METLAEQVEYGDHCMHGTPIGTPGGADLMCGMCESGETVWHDDPTWEIRLGNANSHTATPIGMVSEAELDWTWVAFTIGRYYGMYDPTHEALRALQSIGWVWYMVKTADGYWDTE